MKRPLQDIRPIGPFMQVDSKSNTCTIIIEENKKMIEETNETEEFELPSGEISNAPIEERNVSIDDCRFHISDLYVAGEMQEGTDDDFIRYNITLSEDGVKVG